MATARAIASGNWSATGTWNGGVLPGNGDTVYANGFTVTIDQNIDIGGANNPIVNAGSFVSGQWYEITSSGTTTFPGAASNAVGTIFQANGVGSGTGQARARATLTTATNTAAGATTGGGGFVMNTVRNLTTDIRAGTTLCFDLTASSETLNINSLFLIGGSSTNANAVRNSGAASISVTASTLLAGTGASTMAIANNGTGNISISGGSISAGGGNPGICVANGSATGTISLSLCTITGGGSGVNNVAVNNGSSGNITISSSTLVAGSSFGAINNAQTGTISVNSSTVTASSGSAAISNASSGTLVCTACTITAANASAAISSTNASATNRFSGTFVSSQNGTQPINATRWILNSSPTASYIQHALDGINSSSFVRFYTADNNLGQANPTDVRSGVSYASGALAGRLTVPARGSVALSVNYGPSMPFTATRSGTTATATLAYSYPLVVGDQITVTGASNSEWNSTYTIASVVSGTSVTFTVPDTHSVTAGTGATMQTTGTAVLDPAAVASAVWGAGSRTITGGLVDTATTLTNAPTVPSVVQIRQEMDANSVKLANLDAAVSSRSTLTAAQVNAEADTALADVGLTSTVTGRIDTAISSRLSPSGTLAVVTTLTNAPTVPSATDIATQVRTELATELARVDAAVSTRLAGSSYTAPANSDISAIKAKTDNLPASPAATGDIPTAAQNATAVWSKPANELTVADSIGERAKQQSTVAITGAQLAAALS